MRSPLSKCQQRTKKYQQLYYHEETTHEDTCNREVSWVVVVDGESFDDDDDCSCHIHYLKIMCVHSIDHNSSQFITIDDN